MTPPETKSIHVSGRLADRLAAIAREQNRTIAEIVDDVFAVPNTSSVWAPIGVSVRLGLHNDIATVKAGVP